MPDETEVYRIRASLKDFGKRLFWFSKMSELLINSEKLKTKNEKFMNAFCKRFLFK